MRARAEQRRVYLETAFDVLLGEDRAAGGHAADQRQAELLAQRILQHDAAGTARDQRDHAFALQGAQVLFRGVGGAEAERLRNFRARRRQAVGGDRVLDELEDLALAGREIVRHGSPVWIASACDYIQARASGKHSLQRRTSSPAPPNPSRASPDAITSAATREVAGSSRANAQSSGSVCERGTPPDPARGGQCDRSHHAKKRN
jgi:hypothetical protein